MIDFDDFVSETRNSCFFQSIKHSKIDKKGALLSLVFETEVHPSNFNKEHQWKTNFNELNLDGVVTCTHGDQSIQQALVTSRGSVLGWPKL